MALRGREYGLVVALLLCMAAPSHSEISINGIRLTLSGSEVPYMNIMGQDQSYVLQCDIQGSMDSVANVTWTLGEYGPVYVWNSAVKGKANFPLEAKVDTETHNIAFQEPTPEMRGLYTCIVYSTETQVVNPVQYEYELVMWALAHTEYQMEATEENCTVLWSFSTPPMYPRPEVTCGYWNESASSLAKEVYGGLVYHQYQNLTWGVSMTDVPVEIEDIPQGTTFYCRTDVSFINYSMPTTVPRLANPFLYDQVDDRGCPAIPVLDDNMELLPFACEENCRRECHQNSLSPVVAEFRCRPGHEAYWEHNDTVTYHWRLRVTCDDKQHAWTSEGGQPSQTLDLPYCIYSGCGTVAPSVVVLALVLLLSRCH